jgi:glycosyltransferase involved in cell wall biosynthesis
MSEAPRVLVVVPAYNEDATVGAVVKAVIAAGYRVVVVDDGSSDWTGDRAAAAGATVLRLPVNVGVGGALRCGFRYAVDHGYDVVVQCDADGQHRPEEIPPLLAGIAGGAQLVIGSRFAGVAGAGGGAFPSGRVRRLGMRLVTRLARRFGGADLTDATSGFRAIGRPLLEEFAADYPTEFLGDTVEAVIMAANGGYRIVEVPTPLDPRLVGASRAGALAGGWYVVRLVAAVLLRGGRRTSSRSAHRAPR